ncbi:MAG TPA: AAA family ATPase [Planctomycetota bacterium]|nr:AAA family ATPase [Planctomycetota bacterium]HUW33310.1 AAA family ATPase [Planctomycetota bacterium]
MSKDKETPAETTGYRLTKVSVQNVMKCVAFDWTDDGQPTVTLKGTNGAGKSSILKAIQMVLEGASAVPAEVRRSGAESWEAVVTLEGEQQLVVRRAGKSDGNGTLTITAADGSRIASPQALLDTIVSRCCIDPLRFFNSSDREQAKEIVKAVGDGFDVDGHDAARQKLYDARTSLGREHKRAQATAEMAGTRAELAVIAATEVPVVDDLLAELDEITERNQARVALAAEIERRTSHIADRQKRKGELEAELERVEQDIQTAQAAQMRSQERAEEMGEHVDPAELRKRIAASGETRAAKSVALTALQSWDTADDLAEQVKAQTRKLEEHDETLRRTLASVKLPVRGLSVDLDLKLRYHDRPLSQASTGERLALSVQLAAALRPNLRAIFVDEASVLDTVQLKIISTAARKLGYVVWLAAVDHGQPGLLIEEGRLIGD